jgi:hypothetical protein
MKSANVDTQTKNDLQKRKQIMIIITTIIYMCEKLKPNPPHPPLRSQISRDPPDLERVGHESGRGGGGDP